MTREVAPLAFHTIFQICPKIIPINYAFRCHIVSDNDEIIGYLIR